MATNLIGWTPEEFTAWASGHKEQVRTKGLCYKIPDEVRLDFDSKPAKIIGYASTFGIWYELWPGFFENVARGAFAKTIKEDDVRALMNHDPNYVLGRNKAGTLTLTEDERGLRYEIIAPETSFAKDLMVSIKRKDITQSSFGFNIVEQTFKYDKEKDEVRRTLNEVKLFDVSPVTYPANPSTEAHVRMMAGNSEDSEDLMAVAESIVVPPPPSDEDLFKQFEALKKGAF